MAEKIIIDVFKEKKAEDFTKALSAADGKAASGSAAAYVAAMACALAERVANACAAAGESGERLDYILRNSEILRSYMVHLIDENIKAKRPMERARRDGGEREIEASIQTACCIEAEIVNMMKPCLEFLDELKDICPQEAMHFIPESAELAMSACRISQSIIFHYADMSSDEIYRYVTRRENEVFLAERNELYERICTWYGEKRA